MTGVSRILCACSTFLVPERALSLVQPKQMISVTSSIVIESRSHLNDLLEKLEFVQKVIELLASSQMMPMDRYHVTDQHAAPWIVHLCAILLSLHRAEEAFYRSGPPAPSPPPRKADVLDLNSYEDESEIGTEPCLVERSMLYDLLYVMEKLHDPLALVNLQILVVLSILGSFSEFPIPKLDPLLGSPHGMPAIPAFNPDLVELALQVFKSVLTTPPRSTEGAPKDRKNWEYTKDKRGPVTSIVISQSKGSEFVLECAKEYSLVCSEESVEEEYAYFFIYRILLPHFC